MKKIINYRPILAFAVSMMAGIGVCNFFPTISYFAILLPVIIIAILYFVFSFINRDKGIKGERFTVFLVCMLICLLGASLYMLRINSTASKANLKGEYTVRGTIKTITVKDGFKSCTLTDCSYDKISGGNIYLAQLNGNFKLYDEIEFIADVHPSNIEIDGKYSYFAINDLPLTATNSRHFEKVGERGGFLVKIKRHTDQLFFKGMNQENAAIASALFTGDTSYASFDMIEDYRLTGIAHLFAVSGSNVAMLYLGISFLLSKLPIKRLIRSFIVTVFLILYTGICGFASSAVRAALMCACLSFYGSLGEKKDTINAMAISAIIILVISPNQLFSMGFILSYAVCFGLITLCPTITRALSFMDENFASLIAATVAAQLVSLPISLMAFSSFPLISLLANLLIVPVITVAYYVICFAVFFCGIIPIGESVILYAPQVILNGTSLVTDFMSKFDFGLSYFPIYLTLPYYCLLLASSDFTSFSKRTKIICFVSAFLIIILSAIVI